MITSADDERSLAAFRACQNRRMMKLLCVSKLAEWICSDRWTEPSQWHGYLLRGSVNGACCNEANGEINGD